MPRDSSSAKALAVIAPFANERVREWSSDRFREMIALLSPTHRIVVVGTRAQRLRANLLVRGFDSRDVANLCGRTQWSDVIAAIDEADIVLANNSGIAHVAASRGRWTLCIFAGSHPYHQWRPIGPRVVTVSLGTACSPCEVGIGLCPNGITCMASLEPDFVLELFHDARRRFEAGARLAC